MEPGLAELCHPDPLPGAHRPTAADMHPDPPSRPRTRRPPACPHNTGAWQGSPASPHQNTAFGHPEPPGRAWATPTDKLGVRVGEILNFRQGCGFFRVCACVAEVRVRDVNTERRKCGLRSGKGSGPGGGWARLPGEGGYSPGPSARPRGPSGAACSVCAGWRSCHGRFHGHLATWRLSGWVRDQPAARVLGPPWSCWVKPKTPIYVGTA